MKVIKIMMIILLAATLIFAASGCTGKEYTVKIISNGENYAYKFKEGEEIEIEEMVGDESNRFAGYYLDNNYSERFEGGKATEDMTLYAKWDRYYLVTYEMGGKIVNTEYVKEGNIAGDYEPETENVFEGWYKDAEYVTEYRGEKISGDTKLYGKERANYYRVEYDFCGLREGYSEEVGYGERANLIKEDIGNYKFDGWYKDSEYKESYNSGEGVYENIKLYAKYIAPIKVEIETAGGEIKTEEIKSGESLDLREYEEIGLYYFEGWYKDSIYEEKYEGGKIYSNQKIYGKYIAPLTVTFNGQFGTQPVKVQVKYGEKVERIEDPVSEGEYIFNGWYSNINVSVPYDFDAPVTRNTNIYSGWDEIFDITFYANNGEDAFIVKGREGYPIEEPENPTKEKNEFICWARADGSEYDFSEEIKGDLELYAKWYDLRQDEFKNEYLKLQPDIPMMNITTENGAPIDSKEVYINASFDITSTAAEYVVTGATTQIRGRGNSSWYMEKKSYRLKLTDKKTNMVGLTGSKHYALIANHMDKSLIRNYLAYLFGRVSECAWTPDTRFVEVTLNGEYQGLYLLVEVIRVEEGRVEVDGTPENAYDTGFLVEQITPDRFGLPTGYQDVTFESPNGDFFISAGNLWWELKYPEKADYPEAVWPEVVNYNRTYLDDALRAIFTGNRKNFINYINEETFIDHWMIQELFANFDCSHLSIYINKAQGGKLNMGPIWDFDNAANNISYVFTRPDEVFAQNRAQIFGRLMADPTFKANFGKRVADLSTSYWKYILDSINVVVANIQAAANRNFEKWDITEKVFENPDHILAIKTYSGQVSYLKNWLTERVEWFKESYGVVDIN